MRRFKNWFTIAVVGCVFVNPWQSFAQPGRGKTTVKKQNSQAKNKKKTNGKKVRKRVKGKSFSVKIKPSTSSSSALKTFREKSPQAHCKKQLKQAKKEAAYAMIALRQCNKGLKSCGKQADDTQKQVKASFKKLQAKQIKQDKAKQRKLAYACGKDGMAECKDMVENRVVIEFEHMWDNDAAEAMFRQVIREVCEKSVSKACSAVELYKD